MSSQTVEALRAVYEQSKMVGWDFSRLDGKLVSDDPWWDFESDCLSCMRGASRVADLGTGGGERLMRLLDAVSGEGRTIVATEGWAPNLVVARENLGPRGVNVLSYDAERGEPMPFSEGDLDLVMSRHEAIDASEVARVLAPGGRLLTQQVEGSDAAEIHEWFNEDFLYPHVTSDQYASSLELAGMRIDTVDDWQGTMEFADVSALVTYLALVPWNAPGFTVDKHADRLATLAATLPIRVTQRRFRIYATKL